MGELPREDFLATVKESVENGERFCFILGAGASVTSGIPSGETLRRQWLAEKGKTDTGQTYFDVYDDRFYPNYENGNKYIQRMMRGKTPSYGYYPLVRLLSDKAKHCNIVITTNFDRLTEMAFTQYSEQTPVVAEHEDLAKYINSYSEEPMIAKIHRGMLFEPMSSKDALQCLHEKWAGVLTHIFEAYTPIIIGYAGGDHTMAQFLLEKFPKNKMMYWCWLENEKGNVNNSVNAIIEVNNKKRFIVPIDGFDAIMFWIAKTLEYGDPTDDMRQRAESAIDKYYEEFNELSKQATGTTKQAVEDENDKKIRECSEKINKDNDDYLAYFKRAYAWVEKGECDNAISDYSEAIRIKPDYATAYNNRGASYAEKSEQDKAISDYSEAIRIKPDYATAYNNRGASYAKKGEQDKAISDYSEAIRIKPDSATAYNSRGVSYAKKGEYDNAISDYSEAIRIKPDSATAYNNRGASYAKKGEQDKAISDYSEAIRIRPDYQLAKDNLNELLELANK
ncbi:hypothetical protein FACS18949_02640 [Clostridia bacterium]|nr:hypothetical protein FACS18949_02640 [Clostridia bacterium]